MARQTGEQRDKQRKKNFSSVEREWEEGRSLLAGKYFRAKSTPANSIGAGSADRPRPRINHGKGREKKAVLLLLCRGYRAAIW